MADSPDRADTLNEISHLERALATERGIDWRLAGGGSEMSFEDFKAQYRERRIALTRQWASSCLPKGQSKTFDCDNVNDVIDVHVKYPDPEPVKKKKV